MIRYKKKMSEIHGLGRPCSGRSTEELRMFLSYGDCVPLKIPDSLGGGWSNYRPFDERELKLYDHEDTFENAFTLLPFMPLDECRSVVNQSPRWRLALKAGMAVQFLQPDPKIFQRQCLATVTTLIIAVPLKSWEVVNERLHGYIAIERSLEDLRMKGEHLHDHIKKIDEEWQALSTSKIHEIETHRIVIG